MRDVRKRSDKTDNMFEPLRDTVALLTRFGITMTDVVLKQLEVRWHGSPSRRRCSKGTALLSSPIHAEISPSCCLVHFCPEFQLFLHLARVYKQLKTALTIAVWLPECQALNVGLDTGK